MYLKSVSLQGFKSFPDKTDISFEKSITAIVGPNGSGKSNIADAIKWVLGEQSVKTLRGAKMEDVIFSGTEKRKPLGFAEVSITFDNSDKKLPVDCTEVCVARRYYRSGESEFFINKRSVRLKAIHELFMDTGLGKDGYSIIVQGKIDEILTAKSEDRREFFEEAAGISKFRCRKNEAEGKLAAASENIANISNIILELSNQLEPLKKQSDKAVKFLALRDSLRELEISLWMHDIEKATADRNEVSVDCEAVKRQLGEIREKSQNIFAEIEEIAEKIHRADILTEEKRRMLSEADCEISGIDSQISASKAKISSDLENIERINSEMSEGADKEASLKNQIAEHRLAIEEVQKEYLLNERRLSELSQKEAELLTSSSAIEEQTGECLKEQEKAIRSEAELNSEKAAVETLLTELAGQLNNAVSIKEQKENEAETLSKELDNLSTSLSELCDKEASLLNALDGSRLKCEIRQKKCDELTEQKQQLEIQIKTFSEQVKMLSEMENSYDGFSNAVKQVMKQAKCGFLKNITGTVSDIITVSAEYALAVETALGGAASNIITETEYDAKSAVMYLKSISGGRATFLPVSSVKPGYGVEKSVLEETGVCGLACDMCSFNQKFKDVVVSLLGRTVVVENMDKAIEISKKYSYKFRVVTLDGQVINSGGSITGGSSSKSGGAITRSNTLSEKKDMLNKLSVQYDSIAAKYQSSIDALNAAKYEVKSLTDELEQCREMIRDISSKRSAKNDILQICKNECKNSENNITVLSERIKSSQMRSDVLGSKIAGCRKELDSIEAKVNTLSEGKSGISDKCRQISYSLNKIKEALSDCKVRRASSESALKELLSIYDAERSNIEKDKQLIDRLHEKINALEQAVSRLEHDKDEITEGQRNITAEIARLSQSKMENEILRTSKDKSRQNLNATELKLEKELIRLEASISKFDEQENLLINKLWDEYELTQTDAKRICIPVNSRNEFFSKISKIRADIKQLGNINIDAIEQYKEVNERYTFMSGQLNDLESSREQLVKIISDITSQMKQIFKEQFDIINRNFSETFTEIFGGGTAGIELTDPDDVLGSGIEISVKLPGKSLKTISLLSGGEKAFVSISLYFAILKVRPSPFCILDEIEAALDDVNVDRYADYLHKLCQSTQFIVVTHRRGTMEKSEMLYGVTMREKGVSEIIALNIDDAEKSLGSLN